ncbi:MAG: IS200/IS605 family transposase, partial [Bacteroidota bacterium]|nr:IS200/IS605 family transposase [Bacteroidota bacterium]
MTEHINKRHNKALLLYHIVCPAKYRKAIFTETVEESLKTVCIEISQRYEMHFVEIGADEDHIHYLVQS